MTTHRQTGVNAITLTISALLGLGALGALAGCSGGSSSAPPTASGTAPASGTASAAGPTASAGPATGGAVGKSATALFSGALAALRAGGSVHVDVQDSSTNGSVNSSDDATASGGRQVITVDGTGHATILFIAGVGYVRADARGLADLFELPRDQAGEFADQWIALRPGNKLGQSTYDDVTAGITLSSVATELAPGGTLSLTAPTTIAGQRVVAVQAPFPASAKLPASARSVLYMTDNSLLRPVLSEVTNAGSYKYQMSFSQWGEKLHLSAPANPVPASDVTPVSSIA
jgi:hypothetical protein